MVDHFEPSRDAASPPDDAVLATLPVGRPGTLSPEDEAALAEAVRALEGSSFAAQLSGLVGRQLGFAGNLLPARVTETANRAAATALRYALRGAVRSLSGDAQPPRNRLHLAAVAASGAVGGAFGLATLPLELPLSTALILRSVAEIARGEGEDLDDPEAVLGCLEVFALGTGPEAGLGESSYFAVRALLAKSVTEAARHILTRGIADEAAPVLSRLLGQIASRFGLVVSQKFVAQAVPLLGAVTGAGINAAFMDHYQRLARGHFAVRRLERTYGAALVRAAYERLRPRAPGGEAPGSAVPRVAAPAGGGSAA
ncbi:EcsC family protein [Lichenibacterium ramalinae]|uniref:EcsC family protein n=1 Tax=Lichenibacterium ramalinae TaxID=2316527 RepID=A0A4Q2RDF9_9HYPH|nr:EcsC family protein [Lichenibacterium ramalinae]RYB04927.1 EcsC family protein [Lichenibacterium ramalinae]